MSRSANIDIDIDALARRESEQARNGLLLQLLSAKNQIEPWDHQPCAGAGVKDLDLLVLRDTLVRFGLPDGPADVQALLSHEHALSPFVPPLCAKEPLTGVLRPRHFAILLFGRNPQLFVPGATSSISMYPGRDRSEPVASRSELAGTVTQQFQGIWAILRAQAAMMFDKDNPAHPNLHVYPERALQEALVNAFAHRDYTSPQPTAVTVFEDRVEILSPGALPLGVRLEALRRGRVSPHWRNRGLAWFFRRLELAQRGFRSNDDRTPRDEAYFQTIFRTEARSNSSAIASTPGEKAAKRRETRGGRARRSEIHAEAEGQGIALIRKLMKLEGCPPPRFDASEVHVMCTLRPNPRALEIRGMLDSAFRGARPKTAARRARRHG